MPRRALVFNNLEKERPVRLKRREIGLQILHEGAFEVESPVAANFDAACATSHVGGARTIPAQDPHCVLRRRVHREAIAQVANATLPYVIPISGGQEPPVVPPTLKNLAHGIKTS